eukprot:CAMPEP_0178411076 /NCGR_PEP_ID=MMETSP0689_2-20121128/21310_1 /TAXON_ID=160604 /ORGANISM="Amphidinium massartii, Strain CS-259" /LENGTH=87 /DNA_ID=CAMNT_0020032275 /DNA_START=529 /DNA_END=789 /DNA_ORIENTATION=-
MDSLEDQPLKDADAPRAAAAAQDFACWWLVCPSRGCGSDGQLEELAPSCCSGELDEASPIRSLDGFPGEAVGQKKTMLEPKWLEPKW